MRKDERNEIVGLVEYETIRALFRGRLIEEKKHRRVSVGEHMTFLFENHDTVLLQIQEMLRTERITAEKAIQHEIETYNDLIPGPNELSATLMLEFEDPGTRAKMATALHDLEGHVELRVGGRVCPASFRPLPGEEPGRIPSVNYLRFAVDETAAQLLAGPDPVVLAVRHPAYSAETTLTAETRRALRVDLLSA